MPPVAAKFWLYATAIWALGRLAVLTASAAIGVTLLDAADAGLVPALLVAFTVNVYAVSLLNPVTAMGDAAPVAVKPPGLLVTV